MSLAEITSAVNTPQKPGRAADCAKEFSMRAWAAMVGLQEASPLLFPDSEPCPKFPQIPLHISLTPLPAVRDKWIYIS